MGMKQRESSLCPPVACIILCIWILKPPFPPTMSWISLASALGPLPCVLTFLGVSLAYLGPHGTFCPMPSVSPSHRVTNGLFQ